MHYLIFALLLQTNPHPSHDLMTPSLTTTTKQAVETQSVKVPQIEKSQAKTTPGLGENSVLTTHDQMERDLGTQSSDIGWLKSKVESLESQRKDPDRKDIDSLKEMKTTITIWWTAIVTILTLVSGALLAFKKIIWTDLIKPRLKRELNDCPSEIPR